MHKPPINSAALKRAGAFDEKKFYQDLAANCGYISEDQAKKYYLATVRTLTKHLRTQGVCRLPHLGTFAIVWQNGKWGWAGKQMQRIPGVYVVKFYILESWKEYWTKFTEGELSDASLDPRSRVLNKKPTKPLV